MSEDFQVDEEVVADLGDRLQQTSSRLDRHASSVPQPPDAGAVTTAIAAALGWYADQAETLTQGLAGASSAVGQCVDAVRRQWRGTADGFTVLCRLTGLRDCLCRDDERRHHLHGCCATHARRTRVAGRASATRIG